MMEKRCLLMSTFPRWDEDFVCEEMGGAKAWAYWCWATENRATIFGSMVERASKGYIGQELERLKKVK